MYKLSFLKKENDLNKVLKSQRNGKDTISILFISLWDEWCTALMKKVIDKYAHNKDGKNLYIVDSFKMPHSFVIFNTQKTPHLVQYKNKEVVSEDYLPSIYELLRL